MKVTAFFIERLPTKEKTTAFECGFSSFSDAFGPFNVQYYFTALYFLVFDLELAILIPVIPILPVLSPFGLFFFLFFLLAMLVCVVYERLAFNSN
jgi:NADH:ubiquinone oxidoreductase subunit 3 (subunit A)